MLRISQDQDYDYLVLNGEIREGEIKEELCHLIAKSQENIMKTIKEMLSPIPENRPTIADVISEICPSKVLLLSDNALIKSPMGSSIPIHTSLILSQKNIQEHFHYQWTKWHPYAQCSIQKSGKKWYIVPNKDTKHPILLNHRVLTGSYPISDGDTFYLQCRTQSPTNVTWTFVDGSPSS